MKINPTTMLFTDMTDEEAREVRHVAESIVLDGKFPHPFPQHMQQWMQACGFSESQQLLVGSTAYPQRALLSVIHHHVLNGTVIR